MNLKQKNILLVLPETTISVKILNITGMFLLNRLEIDFMVNEDFSESLKNTTLEYSGVITKDSENDEVFEQFSETVTCLKANNTVITASSLDHIDYVFYFFGMDSLTQIGIRAIHLSDFVKNSLEKLVSYIGFVKISSHQIYSIFTDRFKEQEKN